MFVTINSCNSQLKNRDSVKSIYNSWKKSFVSSVYNENNLLNYQKENLVGVSKNITLSRFNNLRQLLLNISKDAKIDNEFYLLELSEGEVVTAYFYYVIETNKGYQLASINIYEENKEAIRLMKSDSYIEKLINVNAIDSEISNDELFVLTKISDNKTFSIIGGEE